jgi:hypothetical protein
MSKERMLMPYDDGNHSESDLSAENGPERGLEPQEQRQHQITVLYDGILASKMVWDEDRMAKICRAADIRTQIIIRRGQGMPGREYSDVGDVLAMKRIGNAKDLFRKDRYIDEAADISFNSNASRAELRIHDQVLAHKVRDRQGQFDDQTFVDDLNSVVNIGLQTVVSQEKLLQTKCSTAIVGITTLGVAPSVPAFLLFRSSVQEIIPMFQGSVIPHLWAMKVMAGTTFAYIVAVTVAVMPPSVKELMRIPQPYITSNRDLNPLKHVKDLAVGRATLFTVGRKLVSLSE